MVWLKRIWKAGKAANDAYGFVTSDPLKLFVWPVVFAAVTTVSGFLSAVPAPYILAAASFVFAAVATGLLRLDEWRERTDPSGRFRVEVPFYAPELDVAAELAVLKTFQLGLLVKNTAKFSLHYQVEDFYSEIMGRVTTEKRNISPSAEVYPNATTVYRDHIIQVGAPLLKPVETGNLRFKLAYWKTPRRKFYIERAIRFHLRHGPEPGQLGFEWNYE